MGKKQNMEGNLLSGVRGELVNVDIEGAGLSSAGKTSKREAASDMVGEAVLLGGRLTSAKSKSMTGTSVISRVF